MKTLKVLFASLAILGILAIPSVVLAAPSFIPVVSCGIGDTLCTPCDLFDTAENLIDLILIGVTGPLAAFMIVFAGGMMVASGGNVTRFNQGKELLKRTVIGISIIFLAWGAANFIIKSLGSGATTDRWFEFSCPKALQDILPISTTPLPASSGAPEAIVTPALPDLLGRVSCFDASINLCPKQLLDLPIGYQRCDDCSKSNKLLAAAIDAYGGSGIATTKLLKSIASVESICGKSINGLYGELGSFQMKPSTAAMFMEACKVYVYEEGPDGKPTPKKDKDGNFVYKNVNSVLLNKEDYKDAACLAGAYLNSLTASCGSDVRNIIAGYNGGTDACKPSRDCPTMPSCIGGGALVRAWECLYSNRSYTACDEGYKVTRMYVPRVAYCATQK